MQNNPQRLPVSMTLINKHKKSYWEHRCSCKFWSPSEQSSGLDLPVYHRNVPLVCMFTRLNIGAGGDPASASRHSWIVSGPHSYTEWKCAPGKHRKINLVSPLPKSRLPPGPLCLKVLKVLKSLKIKIKYLYEVAPFQVRTDLDNLLLSKLPV